MKLSLHIGNILAGAIMGVIAYSMFFYQDSPVYQEGEWFIGVMVLAISLYVIGGNIYQIIKNRKELDA